MDSVIWINDDLINSIQILQIPVRKRWKKFRAAIKGENNEFSSFVRIRHEYERPSPEVWKKLRTTVFARDDYTCQYCGKRGGRLECDHIQAVSRGGSHELENLVTACFPCNRSKRAKTIEEWLNG